MESKKSMKLIAMTPDLAIEFRDMATIPGDRGAERSERHVKFLLEQFVNGHFKIFDWARIWWLGRWYRVNGSHSSDAVLRAMESGVDISKMDVVLTEWDVEKEEDIISIYEMYDNKNSQRTNNDLMRLASAVKMMETKFECSFKVIKQAANGMDIMTTGSWSSSGKDRCLNMFSDESSKMVTSILMEAHKNKVSVSPATVAQLYESLSDEAGSKTKWCEFWTPILTNSCQLETVQHKARTWLNDHPGSRNKEVIEQRGRLRYMWKAFLAGQNPKQIRVLAS